MWKHAALLAVALAASAPSSAGTWIGRSAAPGANADANVAAKAARAFVAEHLAELAPGASIDDFVLAANVVDDFVLAANVVDDFVLPANVVDDFVLPANVVDDFVLPANVVDDFVLPANVVDDCVLAANVVVGGKRTVSFWQTWRGMRVRGGQLSVVIARDAIFFAQSQAIPFVAMSLGPEVVAARDGRVVIAAETARGYEVRVATHRVRGTWDEWVGLDGRVLVSENRMRDATSTLLYDVPDRRPSMRVSLPAREADILVDGSPVTTGTDGTFTFSGTTASVITGLTGPRVRVVNAAGALQTAALLANDGQPTTWSRATDAFGDAQLSAFVHATIAKDKARALMPGLAWVDQPLTVTVNEPGGACNASSTGDDLHFFAGDAQCENTARIADVVYHELGHSLHFQGLIPGVGNYNLALSEGLADYFAASITGDSAIGRGFKYDNTPVRELDPEGLEKIAPDDLVPSQHQSGLIIGGALWDLRRLLIRTHGAVEGSARADRVFVGVLQRAPNITSSYMAALVGDDDDGDLGNGTPNKCEIDVAFARHGLAPASTPITRFGPLQIDVFDATLPIIPGALSCEPAIETAGLLIGNTILTTTVEADRISATLPRTGLLRFAIEVQYADGTYRRFPENPADPEYTAYVGQTSEIWCERFDADPEWMQTQVGSPSPWEVGVPRGMAGDPTQGYTGQNVLGTQLGGDGRYASVAQTQITTPPIDASNYREVRLQFRRWLVVEDGMYDQASVEVNGTPVWSNATGVDGFLTHQDREWRFVDYDVTPQAASPITVTWKLASDASRALGGWNIDDVCLVGIGKIAVCGDGIVDTDEECDGDNCAADCTYVEDNGFCSAGGNPSGMLLVLGAVAMMRRGRRRR